MELDQLLIKLHGSDLPKERVIEIISFFENAKRADSLFGILDERLAEYASTIDEQARFKTEGRDLGKVRSIAEKIYSVDKSLQNLQHILVDEAERLYKSLRPNECVSVFELFSEEKIDRAAFESDEKYRVYVFLEAGKTFLLQITAIYKRLIEKYETMSELAAKANKSFGRARGIMPDDYEKRHFDDNDVMFA